MGGDYGILYILYLDPDTEPPKVLLTPRKQPIREDSVADPGCLSRTPDLNFSIPDPRSEFFPSRAPDPGSASNNLIILTQKMVSNL
jgi:hypothetical protein